MIVAVRVGLRVAQFGLRTTLNASARAVALAGDVVKSVTGSGGDRTEPWAGAEPPEVRASPERAAEPAPASAPSKAVVSEEPADLTTEPAHVSEEPELVEEFAEPGAEQGAGASITVDEPWSGYDRMGARDVVARLVALSSAGLAAVQLYESAHRRRETVLSAVQRELRRGAATPGQADSN